jgi:hypothetical protein
MKGYLDLMSTRPQTLAYGLTDSPAAQYDRGGHFAALEVPDLLVGDLRSFFRGLR